MTETHRYSFLCKVVVPNRSNPLMISFTYAYNKDGQREFYRNKSSLQPLRFCYAPSHLADQIKVQSDSKAVFDWDKSFVTWKNPKTGDRFRLYDSETSFNSFFQFWEQQGLKAGSVIEINVRDK